MGNCIQSPGINHNGKDYFKKNEMYICVKKKKEFRDSVPEHLKDSDQEGAFCSGAHCWITRCVV